MKSINCGSVEGFYNIIVRDGATLEAKSETGWFKNLITDAGLNRIGTGGIGTHVSVGAGSTPPAVTNTALVAPVATTNNVTATDNNAQQSAPYFGWTRYTYRFNVGLAAGNLSEIGIGWGTGLFSRALIRDADGNPTTITVLSDEVLDVIYELRLYPPLVDQTFDITISGQVHACVLRAAFVTQVAWAPNGLFDYGTPLVNGYPPMRLFAASAGIGTITQGTNGTLSDAASTVVAAYSNNSYKRSMTGTFGLGQANYAEGIKSFLLQSQVVHLGAFQVSVNPPIMKDATKILSLGHELSWARKT